MNTDQWLEFSKEVDKKFNHDLEKIQNMLELNKLWHKLNDTITHAAQKFIPRTKTAPKNFISHTHKATQLHKGLKNINKLLHYLELNIDHTNNLN